MRHIKKILIITIIISIVSVFWVCTNKPWVKEIWITTNVEAFTGPNSGTELISFHKNKVVLNIHTTPASWPKEAVEIYNGAKQGKIVHVTVVDVSPNIKFDVTGLSSTKHLMIYLDTKQDALELADKLKIDIEPPNRQQ